MLAPTQAQQPSAFSGNHSVMMMAPKPLPEDAAAVPVTTNAARPSLVTKDLPYGLVMDGPGTEAYKKKKRRQKKAEEARKAVQEPVVQEEPSAPSTGEQMPDTGFDTDATDTLAPPDDPFGDFGQ